MNPQVAAFLVGCALAYYGGKEVAKGVKATKHAIVHVFHHQKPPGAATPPSQPSPENTHEAADSPERR